MFSSWKKNIVNLFQLTKLARQIFLTIGVPINEGEDKWLAITGLPNEFYSNRLSYESLVSGKSFIGLEMEAPSTSENFQFVGWCVSSRLNQDGSLIITIKDSEDNAYDIDFDQDYGNVYFQ